MVGSFLVFLFVGGCGEVPFGACDFFFSQRRAVLNFDDAFVAGADLLGDLIAGVAQGDASGVVCEPGFILGLGVEALDVREGLGGAVLDVGRGRWWPGVGGGR